MGAEAETPPLVSRNRPLMLVGAMAAMVMYTLDTTIANVALPHMSASLGATQDTISWVLTSYVLASAVVLPLTGWLVDKLGLRRMMLGSVLLFSVASMACGAAQSLEEMVVFRILQGIAGAFLAPLAQTITLDSCTVAERPRMMSLYTQGVMLGPISGPIIGGFLTDNYNWRWVFYVNLPIGLICLAMLLLYLPDTARRERRIDLVGWVLVALAVSALQLILDRGSTLDWFASAEIVIYAVIAAACAWMAVVHLLTADHPLFPLAMFRDANFGVGLALMFLLGLVMMSVIAILPGLLQQIYGYTPLQAGLLMSPRGLGMMVSMLLFGRHMGRFDPRLLLAIGLGLMGLSLVLMTRWSIAMPQAPIFLTGMMQGVGISFTFVPMSLISFATLAPAHRTDGSSLATLMRNVGSSIGISSAAVLLARNVQVNHAEIGTHVTPAMVPFPVDRAAAFGPAAEAALRVVDGLVNRQAAMIAYLDDFYAMALACFLAIPLLLVVKPPRKARSGGGAGSGPVAEAAGAVH